MPRRRLPEPDTRPHWDDPDLPCFSKHGQPMDPAAAVSDAQVRMSPTPVFIELPDGRRGWLTNQNPDWRHDPTYNLRKR